MSLERAAGPDCYWDGRPHATQTRQARSRPHGRRADRSVSAAEGGHIGSRALSSSARQPMTWPRALTACAHSMDVRRTRSLSVVLKVAGLDVTRCMLAPTMDALRCTCSRAAAPADCMRSRPCRIMV